MYTGNGEGAGFHAFSGVQIALAEYALAGWDELMSADFVHGAGFTDLEFGYTTTGIGYAHAYYPDTGSVWFNAGESTLFNPVLGDYGYETFLHEIGHALGLDHMGDYDASDPQSVHPYSYQDSSVLSVMSYFGPSHFDGEGEVMWADWTKGGNSYSVQTPMVNDVMAIQAMYGVETTTRAGDTVYGFNSNVAGSAAAFFDFTVNGNPILTIFDSGGVDTLDLSGYSTRCSISLVAGSYSDCNDMTFNIGIAYTATIENAVGGSKNDTITGNDVSNILIGGGGNDTIEGGDGTDIAVFSGLFADYTITATGTGSYMVFDKVGNEGTDTLSSIELLRFSDKDVTGEISDTAPIVAAPLVDQRFAPDAFITFTIPNGAFSDPNGDPLTYSAVLEGGVSLPTWLSFDAGTRTFSGTPAAGNMGVISIVVTASDGSESASDIFDLVIGNASGEDIIGTKRSDHLFGTEASELVLGRGGRDIIEAGAGDDTVVGGAKFDQLWGDAGSDAFVYRAVKDSAFKNGKFDRIMDFDRAEGDTIDLSSIDANLKRAGNQNFKFDAQGDGWGKTGELSYWIDNGQTHIYGNTDRDKKAELYIVIDGAVDFQASDFIL